MELLGGPLFSVAGAGESHSPGIVTIVFGCPPGLWLTRDAIQDQLDRRRPGSTRHGTPRHEADRLVLLSGIYQDDYDRLLGGPEAAVGEARLHWGGGDLDTLGRALEGWRAAGATYVSLNTMGSGFRTAEEHLAAIRLFAENRLG